MDKRPKKENVSHKRKENPSSKEEGISTPMQLSAIIFQAKRAGIKSFIFGFQDESSKNTIIHYENMSIGGAVNMHATGWLNSIDMELDKHPEYSKEYKQIFLDGKDEFKALIEKINKKVAAFKK